MKFLIALILLASTLLSPAFSRADELTVVKSEGVALRSGDIAEVRRKAIDQALKNAVVEASGVVIKKDSIDVNPDSVRASVASSPRAYVINYRILAEGWINHMEDIPPLPVDLPDSKAQTPGAVELFHIWIEASVDTAQLRGEVMRIAGGTEATSTVTLNIVDVTDYGAFKSLMASLGRISVVKDLSYDSFSRGRIEVKAKIAGTSDTLSEKVAREAGDNFLVISGGPGMIIIKPAKKAAE